MAKLDINGKLRNVEVEDDTPLLWVIREQIGLTGTKYGCGVAQCGACSVHINGEVRRSCAIPVGTLKAAGPHRHHRGPVGDPLASGANPGMLWVERGEKLWRTPAGAADTSCASCHGEARVAMRGVAARYPAHDAATGRVLDLEARIDDCRARRQQARDRCRGSRTICSRSPRTSPISRADCRSR